VVDRRGNLLGVMMGSMSADRFDNTRSYCMAIPLITVRHFLDAFHIPYRRAPPAEGRSAASTANYTMPDIVKMVHQYLPEEFHSILTILNLPQSVHQEGPKHGDHLLALFNGWKSLQNDASIPEQYRKLLSDPAENLFFTLFILIHDLGKVTVIPKTVVEEGHPFQLYAGHEQESFRLANEHPVIRQILSKSPHADALRTAIRLHGALYGISRDPVTAAQFETFVRENGIPENDMDDMIPRLIACCLIDVHGTLREDPWHQRPLNFSKGYEEYRRMHPAAAPTKKPNGFSLNVLPMVSAVVLSLITIGFMTWLGQHATHPAVQHALAAVHHAWNALGVSQAGLLAMAIPFGPFKKNPGAAAPPITFKSPSWRLSDLSLFAQVKPLYHDAALSNEDQIKFLFAIRYLSHLESMGEQTALLVEELYSNAYYGKYPFASSRGVPLEYTAELMSHPELASNQNMLHIHIEQDGVDEKAWERLQTNAAGVEKWGLDYFLRFVQRHDEGAFSGQGKGFRIFAEIANTNPTLQRFTRTNNGLQTDLYIQVPATEELAATPPSLRVEGDNPNLEVRNNWFERSVPKENVQLHVITNRDHELKVRVGLEGYEGDITIKSKGSVVWELSVSPEHIPHATATLRSILRWLENRGFKRVFLLILTRGGLPYLEAALQTMSLDQFGRPYRIRSIPLPLPGHFLSILMVEPRKLDLSSNPFTHDNSQTAESTPPAERQPGSNLLKKAG
jgi:hypothetical protein